MAKAEHPPFSAQAAAEEEKGCPRDLQCLPARVLKHLPV